jgi:hypothetical protein
VLLTHLCSVCEVVLKCTFLIDALVCVFIIVKQWFLTGCLVAHQEIFGYVWEDFFSCHNGRGDGTGIWWPKAPGVIWLAQP